MDGDKALAQFADRVRNLRELAIETAKEAAPLVEEAARAAARQGVGPDGKPWAPKKGGGRPLVRAAGAVSARVKGTVVELVVTGHHVFHQTGAGDLPSRPMIPERGTSAIPPAVADALTTAASRAFERVMRGA